MDETRNEQPEREELDPVLQPAQEETVEEQLETGIQEDSVTTVAPEEEIAELRKELDESKEKYLRLYAEFDNYRKRAAKDREELRKQANERIIMEILTVVDHLEMAVSHSRSDALENVIKGVELTLKEFERLLENNGVKAIEAKGKEFDPNLHHAMTQVSTTDAPANTVVEEFRRGYLLNDRVIRPSLVGVATPPESGDPTPASGDTSEDTPGEKNPESAP